MRPCFAIALTALALGYVTSLAQALDPASSPSQGQGAVRPAVAENTVPAHPESTTPALLDDDGHDEAAHSGHFVAGLGFYYVRPHWESNPAFAASYYGGNGGGERFVTQLSEFNGDYELAPRMWLGFVTGSGLGARTRYWRFDGDIREELVNEAPTDGGPITVGTGPTQVVSVEPLGVGPVISFGFEGTDSLVFTSGLTLDVLDLEATQEVSSFGCSLLLTGGLRYAHMRQSYNAFLSHEHGADGGGGAGVGGIIGGIFGPGVTGIDDDPSETLLSRHNFQGAGPTVSLEVRRSVAGTGLALFAGARGAVLFGHGRHSAYFVRNFEEYPDGGCGQVDISVEAHSERHDWLPVTEFEIGTEWSKELGSGRLFVRTALVSQKWYNAGNSSDTPVFAGGGGVQAAYIGGGSGGSGLHSDLGFFGLTVTTGVNF